LGIVVNPIMRKAAPLIISSESNLVEGEHGITEERNTRTME